MDRRILWLIIAAVLAIHTVISVDAMIEVGYIDIFTEANRSWAARQVFSDLSAALLLLSFLLVPDARRLGINPWPYVLAMVPLGSFAPLAYFIHREIALARRR